MFRNEGSTPGLSLLRASVEWRIRHKLSQTFQPSLHHRSNHRHKQSKWITWRKPRGGLVKINLDGSKNSQMAAEGFVICDWDRRFLQAASFNLRAASVLVAETTTMRNGLKAAAQVGFTDIHMEGDNRILIQVVKMKIQIP